MTLRCAGHVLTEGNTLLGDTKLEKLVILRMIRRFMEFMRENYKHLIKNRLSLVPFESCSQVIFSGELCLIFYSWCSMLGQRTNALHTGCDSSHSNPPYTLAQLTTHNSRAVCTCVTVPLDAHMWAEPTNSMRLPRGAFEGLRIFVLARSRKRKVGTASLGAIHAAPV